MKKLLFLAAMLLPSLAAYTQTVTVADGNTMAPMAGVVVSTKGNPVAITNGRGQFELSSLQGGDSLVLEITGFEKERLATRELAQRGYVVSLFPKTYQLDDVVVSANRFDERAEDVAQPVEVINSKNLAFQNQSTSADVLSSTGNVLVQKSQLGGGSPIIRGFEANKVLMVVDGVRMNNAIYRGGHLQNVVTLDNASMDKVEILFGPGSTVYGSDALGGVMHFYTKNPLLNDKEGVLVKANAFARFGTAAGEVTGHGDISIGSQKFGSLTSVTFSRFGDLRQGNLRNPFYGDWGKRTFYVDQINGVDSVVANPDVNKQVGSGYTQYDVLQKFLFKQNERISHTLNIQFSNSGDVPRYDRLTVVGGNGNPTFAEWYYGPQKRLFGSYTLGLTGGHGFYDSGRVIVAYQNIEESRHDRRFRSDNFNHRTEKLDILTLNADLSKTLGTRHELRYGLEGTYNIVNSTAERTHPSTGESEPLDTRYPNGGSTMQSAAIYGTHNWEIIPHKLILNDGIRLSHVGLHSSWTDTTFFPFPFKEVTQSNLAVTGNLGIVYMPGSDWRFSLLGSTGFRAPNVDDMSKVFESVQGRVIVPNPELKPENTYNLDLNLSKTIAETATISAGAFYTLYRNAITTTNGTFQGQDSVMYDGSLSQVITSVNATEAYIYGGNAVISIKMGNHFRLMNTINYTFGRIKTDTTDYPLDHIAPMFGRTSLQMNLKRFRGEFFVMWNGWKRLKDYNLLGEDNFAYATPEGMPAWMTLNVRAAYQIHKHLQAQVALENILDQNYRVFASNIGSPGRNLVVTLRTMF